MLEATDDSSATRDTVLAPNKQVIQSIANSFLTVCLPDDSVTDMWMLICLQILGFDITSVVELLLRSFLEINTEAEIEENGILWGCFQSVQSHLQGKGKE